MKKTQYKLSMGGGARNTLLVVAMMIITVFSERR